MALRGLIIACAVLLFALPCNARQDSPLPAPGHPFPARRAVILVLPDSHAPDPDGTPWRASLDFHAWFELGDDPGPGATLTLSRDWVTGPLGITLFIEGGLVFRRTSRLEERSFEGSAGSETVIFHETVLVREFRADPVLWGGVGAGPGALRFLGWRIEPKLRAGAGLLADQPASAVALSLFAWRKIGRFSLGLELGAGAWFSDRSSWRLSVGLEAEYRF